MTNAQIEEEEEELHRQEHPEGLEGMHRGLKAHGDPTEILPYLLLGSSYNCSDERTLRRLGITHVLNAASELPRLCGPAYAYRRVDIEDYLAPGNHQHPIFESAFQFIDEARRAHEAPNRGCDRAGDADEHKPTAAAAPRVLVHCARGRSRSATLVIGYLMTRHEMSLRDAFFAVKRLRPSIGPHRHLQRQLIDFELDLRKEGSMTATDFGRAYEALLK